MCLGRTASTWFPTTKKTIIKTKTLSSNIYIENSIKNTKTLGRTTNFYSCETIKIHISHHLYTCTAHNFCNLQYKFINDRSQFNKGKTLDSMSSHLQNSKQWIIHMTKTSQKYSHLLQNMYLPITNHIHKYMRLFTWHTSRCSNMVWYNCKRKIRI